MAMSSGGYHHHHQQQHQQQQEMHVRWRHHQAGLLATLQQMLSSEAFVDVTLCCQGRRLRAHRVLLSASSPYLQELLMAHPASDHTTIILDDVAWEDMRALLDFMYTGGVTVPEARLAGLLEAARVLRVTVLTDGALHQRLPAAKRHPPPLIKVPYGGYPYHYHYQNGYKTESKPWPEPLSNGVKVEDQPDSPHSHHHPYSPVNSLKMDTSSSGSASPEFPWARPLPSLMPIAAAARRAPPPPPAPRRAPPAILTPSPWAQNGRPQAGAPRVRSCQDVSPRPTQDSPEARFSSPPAYAQHLDSNGVHHRQSSPRSEGDSSSDPPPTMALPRERGERENDENRPDGRLKERRLTEFYREQLLTNALKPPEDLSQPPLVDKMQRYSEQPFNFPMSRILGASADPAVSPLHGMRTLASLLEDGPASKDRDSADSVLAPRLNVNNNNDTDDCGKQCDVLDKRVGVVHPNSKASPPHDRRSPDRQLIAGDRLQSTHPAGDPSGMVHACQHCPKTFVTRASLKVHLRTHTGEKPFQCGECGKQFSQLRNYKYHRSVHEGTREFAATCPECGKYFNDRGYLSSHMKIHRNRKEYGCEYCGKSFNQRVAYNMHVRIHTGEKPHVCQHCGKSFSRKMLLKQHLRIHTGEKPFTCVVCQKAFADRSNMTLHMRLHSGVKPYTCNVCNKSFTKKHHLKTHMNYHTGVKPYSCAKCGLRFSQSSNMRTHFKKCNSTPPPPPTTPPATPLNMTVEAKEAA